MIRVLNENEYEIFNGDSEDFLYQHDNDMELEMYLNQLETSTLDSIEVEIDGETFYIEKELDLLFD